MAFVPPSFAWKHRSLVGPAGVPPMASCTRGGCTRGGFHPARWTQSSRQPTPDFEDSDDTKIARLMAVLFVAGQPLSTRKLSQYANLADGTEARTLVARLNRQLDSTGRAFRAEPVAHGFQLVTRPKFAKWLRRLEYVPGEVRLSVPAMETLAVIAYRQPVMRSEVEAIRGVGCGEIISQLLSRDLIRIGGRSTELGRPFLYTTTNHFLQIFGLRSLDELPQADISRMESPDSKPFVATRTTSETSELGQVEEELT